MIVASPTAWRCCVKGCKVMVQLRTPRPGRPRKRKPDLPQVPICPNHLTGLEFIKLSTALTYGDIFDAWLDRKRVDFYALAVLGPDLGKAKRRARAILRKNNVGQMA